MATTGEAILQVVRTSHSGRKGVCAPASILRIITPLRGSDKQATSGIFLVRVFHRQRSTSAPPTEKLV